MWAARAFCMGAILKSAGGEGRFWHPTAPSLATPYRAADASQYCLSSDVPMCQSFIPPNIYPTTHSSPGTITSTPTTPARFRQLSLAPRNPTRNPVDPNSHARSPLRPREDVLAAQQLIALRIHATSLQSLAVDRQAASSELVPRSLRASSERQRKRPRFD